MFHVPITHQRKALRTPGLEEKKEKEKAGVE